MRRIYDFDFEDLEQGFCILTNPSHMIFSANCLLRVCEKELRGQLLLVGYVRVSTGDQNLDLHLRALTGVIAGSKGTVWLALNRSTVLGGTKTVVAKISSASATSSIFNVPNGFVPQARLGVLMEGLDKF